MSVFGVIDMVLKWYKGIVLPAIHYSLHAIKLGLIASTKFNTLRPIWAVANFAQSGASYFRYSSFYSYLDNGNKRRSLIINLVYIEKKEVRKNIFFFFILD